MDLDFDKEMDSLLRRAAQSEAVFGAANPTPDVRNAKSLHLDADEISAFAENALPETARLLYIEHFADCDRCRKILSNVIALNAEFETAPPAETEKINVAAPAPISWYRRFFGAPGLAYAMGALVLIFAGLIAFTFLKNAPLNAEVSQVTSEKPIGAGGASGDGEVVTTERNAAGASMSNGGLMQSNASAMANSMLSNSATTRGALPPSASAMSNGASVSSNSDAAVKEEAKNKSQTEPARTANERAENQERPANFPEQKQPPADNEIARLPTADKNLTDASPVAAAPKPPAPKTNAPDEPLTMSARSATELSGSVQARKSRRAAPETQEARKVGDRTFRRAGGVWYDASYNGQSTTNVARGTKEYRNLDSGVRSIAETLSGTILVVWKGKAYRIQ